MSVSVFDPSICALGEGPLWHPGRGQLFWFDILSKRLFTREDGATRHWQFDEHVSAAGWVDDDTLLVASETGLSRFDLTSGTGTRICDLEADVPANRSNDGRADPRGGFWIGTMAKDAAKGAGAIYRFHKGKVRRLFDDITIPNAICFAPDGSTACFADTETRAILRVALDPDGWPAGAPDVLIDLAADGWNPDGAVIDASGTLWNAQWGGGRVAGYSSGGAIVQAIELPARQVTCPAFAPDGTMFVTSAADGDDGPAAGQTFAVRTAIAPQAEHRVLL